MKSYPGRRYWATPALRAKMVEQGRRADWLADQIGVSPSYLSKVFARSRRLSELQARIAAGVLHGDFLLLFESPIGDERITVVEQPATERVPA